MMCLIPLLQPPKDSDGIFHTGFSDEDLLEPAFEGRVFFNILAVFIKRCSTNKPQLTAGQHRLEHVAGIHGPFSCAGANDSVDLINESDNIAVRFFDLIEHCFHALFKFTAVFAACNHRAHIKGDDPPVLQPRRDVTCNYALGKSFYYSRFPYSRLADKDRVVFGPAAQYLDDTAYLCVTTDYGVELPFAGTLCQVD